MKRKKRAYLKKWRNIVKEIKRIKTLNNGKWPGTFFAQKHYCYLFNALNLYHGGHRLLNRYLGIKSRFKDGDINHRFRKWSNNLAYLLGLIVTDGHLHSCAGYEFKTIIKLSEQDKDILISIHKWLGLKNKIIITSPSKPSRYKGKWIKGNQKQHTLTISGKSFLGFCVEKGISLYQKTFKQGRMKIPRKYFAHFLRGVIDGDGCISHSVHNYTSKENKKQYQYSYLVVTLVGTRKFLFFIQNQVSKILKVKQRKICKTPDKIYKIAWRGKEAVKIRDYMYKNADLFLTRKKQEAFK